MTAPRPPLPDQRLATARRMLAERRWQAAHDLAAAVATAEPTHAEALFLMGRARQDAGDTRGAADMLRKASAADPRAAEPLIFLGRAYCDIGVLDQARAAALRALDLAATARPPLGGIAYDTLGVVLSRTGAHAEATGAARRATELEPNRASFWRNRGWAELHQGDTRAAEAAFRTAMRLDPADHQAPAALVELRPQSEADNIVPTLERLFEAARDPDRRLALGHALAKSLEDMGRAEEAFDWLGRGKVAKRAAIGYQPAQDEALFEAARASVPAGSSPLIDDPIFVLGLPRSGTTLIDRIISSHPDVVSVGEPLTFPRAARALTQTPNQVWLDAGVLQRAARLDPAALGRAYLDTTRPLADRPARILDKTPVNYLFAGLIHAALPAARIVCVRRHPLDSVLSVFRQSFGPRTQYRFTYDLEDAARYYVLFDRLVAHWRAVLPPGRFMEVSYEAVVADLEPEARRLLAFCDLDWSPVVLTPERNAAAVDSASAAQVRRPVYSSSIGRWRRLGARMDPARRILEAAGLIDSTGEAIGAPRA